MKEAFGETYLQKEYSGYRLRKMNICPILDWKSYVIG